MTRSCRFQGNDGRAPVEAARDTVRYRTALHPFERIGNIVSAYQYLTTLFVWFFIDLRSEGVLHRARNTGIRSLFSYDSSADTIDIIKTEEQSAYEHRERSEDQLIDNCYFYSAQPIHLYWL